MCVPGSVPTTYEGVNATSYSKRRIAKFSDGKNTTVPMGIIFLIQVRLRT